MRSTPSLTARWQREVEHLIQVIRVIRVIRVIMDIDHHEARASLARLYVCAQVWQYTEGRKLALRAIT